MAAGCGLIHVETGEHASLDGIATVSELYLNRAQSRRYDQLAIEQFGIPGIVLMENAARNCVDVMEAVGISGEVLVACGRGNNGGDGYSMARHLALRGYAVHVVEADSQGAYSDDAAVNREILLQTGWQLHGPDHLPALQSSVGCCVDALLGTGARGEPRPPFAELITQLNALDCPRWAVDLPSGLDCDTGECARATFHADHTCTFVAKKAAMRHRQAADACGQIHVVDVGAPRSVLEALLQEPPA